MATNFQSAVHRVVYSALNGNVSGWGVYDHVPSQPEGSPDDLAPYIELGNIDARPWDNDDERGVVADVTINLFSVYRGGKEVRGGMDAVYTLLHRAGLSSSGYNIIDSFLDFSDISLLPDGKTRMGTMRFRLTIQEQ